MGPRFLATQLVFMLNHVLLLIGLLGLLRSGATGAGRPGRVGLWISIAGMAALTLYEVAATTPGRRCLPSPATDVLDTWFGITSILIGPASSS